jgi:hypothetical protein
MFMSWPGLLVVNIEKCSKGINMLAIAANYEAALWLNEAIHVQALFSQSDFKVWEFQQDFSAINR